MFSRLSLSVLSAALVVAQVSCASAPGSSCSSPPSGIYQRTHVASYFEAAEKREAEVTDKLELKSLEGCKLEFSLTTVGGNLHTCGMEGTAVWTGGYFEYRKPLDEVYQDPEPCVLRILRTDEGLVVEDVGSRCRKEWCGVRASIGRTVFPLRYE